MRLLKTSAKKAGIKNVRVQKSGCLDFCEFGTTCVVYPEGVFYGNVQVEDVAEITKSHLIEDEIVTRLQIQ